VIEEVAVSVIEPIRYVRRSVAVMLFVNPELAS
jgi:hypothetical protein